jgi:hypothetical protein
LFAVRRARLHRWTWLEEELMLSRRRRPRRVVVRSEAHPAIAMRRLLELLLLVPRDRPRRVPVVLQAHPPGPTSGVSTAVGRIDPRFRPCRDAARPALGSFLAVQHLSTVRYLWRAVAVPVNEDSACGPRSPRVVLPCEVVVDEAVQVVCHGGVVRGHGGAGLWERRAAVSDHSHSRDGRLRGS